MPNNIIIRHPSLRWAGAVYAAFSLWAGATLAHANEAVITEVTTARLALREAVAAKRTAAVDAHLSKDFVFVHSTGRTNNKTERVTSLLTGNAMETQPEEEVSYQAIDGKTVVVRGQTRMPARGNNEAFVLKWNSVYLRGDAGWAIAYMQSWR